VSFPKWDKGVTSGRTRNRFALRFGVQGAETSCCGVNLAVRWFWGVGSLFFFPRAGSIIYVARRVLRWLAGRFAAESLVGSPLTCWSGSSLARWSGSRLARWSGSRLSRWSGFAADSLVGFVADLLVGFPVTAWSGSSLICWSILRGLPGWTCR
jgi:hypothetical protein